MEEILEFISNELEKEGVPYEFLIWTRTVTYPYFVGECNEYEPTVESGEQDKTFILNGFCRGEGSRLKLEEMRAKIEKIFPDIGGKKATLNSGSAVAIFYGNSFYVPTGEEELYNLQINLNIKFWKVG